MTNCGKDRKKDIDATAGVPVKSEGHFCRIFNASPLPIAISRLEDGCVIDVNEAFLNQMGYKVDEVVGKYVADLNFWADPADREHFISLLKKEKEIKEFEIRYINSNGKEREALAAAELFELDGEQCILTILQDITDIKRTEKELRDKEAHIEAIINAIPDLIFIMDSDGILRDSHAPDPQLYYVPPEKFLGKHYSRILPEDMHEEVDEALYRLKKTGHLQIFNYSMVVKGRQHFFEGRLVRCKEGEILAIIRDVSEETRLSRKLVSKERLAAVGKTMTTAAHCTKNIFSSIKGAAALLDMALESEDLNMARKASSVLKKSSSRLYTLMMEMLDYSKVREPNMKEIRLEKIFEEVTHMLKLITGEKVEIIYHVESGAEVVKLDPDLTFRILLNLGQNSLDAMPDGGTLKFLAAMLRRDKDPEGTRGGRKHENTLLIEVIDTGVGIEKKHLGKIFDPTFSTKGAKGTGLGLATVKQFVEAQKGKVKVETEKEEGSTFRLYFPQNGI